MTKEPKIDAAKRIIREWVDLDQHAARLEDQFRQLQPGPAARPSPAENQVGLAIAHTEL